MVNPQVDLALVKELVEPARKAYAAAFGEEAPTITIDSRDFLPPPPKAGDADAAGWWAGWHRCGRPGGEGAAVWRHAALCLTSLTQLTSSLDCMCGGPYAH
jgi:hypothetical protein